MKDMWRREWKEAGRTEEEEAEEEEEEEEQEGEEEEEEEGGGDYDDDDDGDYEPCLRLRSYLSADHWAVWCHLQHVLPLAEPSAHLAQ